MEQIKNNSPLLEMIDRPVLCVRDGVIIDRNRSAAQMQIGINTPIKDLLPTDYDAYTAFTDGQLYLTVHVADIPCGAIIIRSAESDYFVLEQQSDFEKLQLIALAAQQLRNPLSNVMNLTDNLLSNKDLDETCELREQAKRINKGLFQLLRIIANMADAPRYMGPEPVRKETVNFTAFLNEVFEKAATLISDTGVTLKYKGLNAPVFGLVATECLERGLYNIISNAVKFSPKKGTVEITVSQVANVIKVSVQDNGRGIPSDVRGNLFTRYQRTPGIEDGRYGIGLGMTMVRTAASVHGGTVLVDHPQSSGTRVTLTIPITKDDSNTVRTPIMQMFDYTGGWDHALVELAESLSIDAYDQ